MVLMIFLEVLVSLLILIFEIFALSENTYITHVTIYYVEFKLYDLLPVTFLTLAIVFSCNRRTPHGELSGWRVKIHKFWEAEERARVEKGYTPTSSLPFYCEAILMTWSRSIRFAEKLLENE